MKKSKVSYISEKDGMKEENFLVEYSEEEKQQNEINAENASKIFTPEFIPFYSSIKIRFNLSYIQTLIYGFIRFYMVNGSGRFYFTDKNLAQIFGCNESTIGNSIKKLAELKLIDKHFKIKADGGRIRFITNIRSLNTSASEPEKLKVLNTKNLREKYNKINNNKINKYDFKKNPYKKEERTVKYTRFEDLPEYEHFK